MVVKTIDDLEQGGTDAHELLEMAVAEDDSDTADAVTQDIEALGAVGKAGV